MRALCGLASACADKCAVFQERARLGCSRGCPVLCFQLGLSSCLLAPGSSGPRSTAAIGFNRAQAVCSIRLLVLHQRLVRLLACRSGMNNVFNTTVQTVKGNCTWNVNGFRLLPAEVDQSKTNSPDFFVGPHKFRLRLDTNCSQEDDKEKKGGHVGLYLSYQGDSVVKAECRFVVKAAAAVLLERLMPVRQYNKKGCCWGYHGLSRDRLLAAASRNQDCLQVTTEVTVVCDTVDEALPSQVDAAAQHPHSLAADWQAMLSQASGWCVINACAGVCLSKLTPRACSDAKLVVGNTSLDVHKVVLSARSPVFAAMFASKMSEAKNGEVVIDDMELSVAKEMIR
jgi:hypothetical protein